MRKTVINFGLLAAFVVGAVSVHSYVLDFDPRLVTQVAGMGLLAVGLIGSAVGALFMPVSELRARRLLFHAAVLAVIGGWVLVLSLSERELFVASLAVAPFLSALALTWFMDRICPATDSPARYEDRVIVIGAVLMGFLSALARVPFADFLGVAVLYVAAFTAAFIMTARPKQQPVPQRPASMRPERTRVEENVWAN